MGLQLDKVVPWGRSLAEYCRMFDLSPTDLQQQILDCGGGPASFTAEMTQQGYRAIACDPIYQFPADDIRHRITDTYTVILEQLHQNQQGYCWHEMQSPDHLGQIRMAAMQQFLDDFPAGKQAERYCVAALPRLPFATDQFDLALCSHFLFTYSDHLSLPFHLDAIREMCRVAVEVRIFPLLTLAGEPSLWLEPVTTTLTKEGYDTQIQTVLYEFQRGGNQQLKVRRQASH